MSSFLFFTTVVSVFSDRLLSQTSSFLNFTQFSRLSVLPIDANVLESEFALTLCSLRSTRAKILNVPFYDSFYSLLSRLTIELSLRVKWYMHDLPNPIE